MNAANNVSVHLNQAAVRIERKSAVAAPFGQPFNGGLGEANVKDRVHHAGHGGSGTGANGHEQRAVSVAKLGTIQCLFDVANTLIECADDQRAELLPVLIICGAHRGWQREPWRYRNTEVTHFCEVSTFTTEQIPQGAVPIGVAFSERIPYSHGPLMTPLRHLVNQIGVFNWP